MIETIYKTRHPDKDKSERYVLVLTSRPTGRSKTYSFMEEHGHWDDSANRFLHDVSSIRVDEGTTHSEALGMYNNAKEKLAERGFIYSFSPDYREESMQVIAPKPALELLAV
jgi:hypothetical protein